MFCVPLRIKAVVSPALGVGDVAGGDIVMFAYEVLEPAWSYLAMKTIMQCSPARRKGGW